MAKRQVSGAIKVLVPVIGSVLIFRGLADVLPELSGWNSVGAGLVITFVGIYYLGVKR